MSSVSIFVWRRVVSWVGVAAMEICVLKGVQGSRLVGGHTVTADGILRRLTGEAAGQVESPLVWKSGARLAE